MTKPAPEDRAAYVQELIHHVRNVLNEIEAQVHAIHTERQPTPAAAPVMLQGVLGDDDAEPLAVEQVQPAESWSNRLGRKENPIAFIRRLYAPWIGRGLTRAHIRTVDRPLYRALGVWLHRHPDEAFADVPARAHGFADLLANLPPDRQEALRKMGVSLENRRRKEK